MKLNLVVRYNRLYKSQGSSDSLLPFEQIQSTVNYNIFSQIHGAVCVFWRWSSTWWQRVSLPWSCRRSPNRSICCKSLRRE
ncbi:unnamed protein product [Meloidogyne enterolobii]|uniref:Uncharacterized protein n=1 Tax=Meloidogyne enterolobii TaxID=390850 RepID=A0ACB1A6F9_MELEN